MGSYSANARSKPGILSRGVPERNGHPSLLHGAQPYVLYQAIIKLAGTKALETHTEERIERRSGTQQMIRNLLAERQEMLVAYCSLAGLEPYRPEKPVKRQLEEFCQLLMDYTAFGHFELYRRISEGSERRQQVVQVARHVFPKIAEVTESAVAFNDKYDASDHELKLESLSGDLSALGESLAVRLELEDQIVKALLTRGGGQGN
jgi:regulator of sigma D